MTEKPSSPSSPFPWLAFLIGAVAGGLVASAIGGIVGALLGWGGAAMLHRPWPPTIRWLAALLTWSLGWTLLWIGSGYARAVQGLLRALGP